MGNPATVTTFPLRLEPLEEQWLFKDRPGYPMHVWCRMWLRGKLDRDALAKAFEKALVMHPLLTAVIDRSAGARPCWVQRIGPRELAQKQLIWCDEPSDERIETLAEIDLENSSGCRLLVAQREETVRLVGQFHHAACDGLGLLVFLLDLLQHYHALVTGDLNVLPSDRNVDRLRARSRFGYSRLALMSHLPALHKGVPNFLWYLLLRVSPLTTPPPTAVDTRKPYRPGWLTHTFSRQESTGLKQKSRQRGVSVNDQLICDLFLALAKWQRRRGVFDSQRWLRIAIPLNMRLPVDWRMTAANMASVVFVSRRGEILQRPADLLRGLHVQMARVGRYRLGLIFLLLARVLRSLGWLDSIVNPSRCLTTTVLTNVGKVFYGSPLPRNAAGRMIAGELVLEEVGGGVALDPVTHAAFAVGFYAGALSVGLHYDSRVLSADDGMGLMDDFITTVRASSQG